MKLKIEIQHDCVVIERSYVLCKWRENALATIACRKHMLTKGGWAVCYSLFNDTFYSCQDQGMPCADIYYP